MQSHENSGLLGERNDQQTTASIRGKRLVVVAIATVLVVLFVFAMDSSSSSGTLLTLGRKKEMTSLRVPALKKHKEHLESPLTTLYYLNETSAFDRLETDGQSSSALDFFNYVQGGWDAQINQMFCPIASCAAVLNSLKGLIELPMDPIYSPFHWATQNNIVKTDCFKQLWSGVDKEEDVIVGPLRLDAAGSLLNCLLEGQGYTVQVIHMNPTVITKDEARDIIKDAVLDENSRVLINYDRGGIGQGPLGHGHFSPIGAYNQKLDAFLIMDVAKYKYPPVFVPTLNLYNGISTIDHCTKWDLPDCETDYRGIIIARPS